jgi:hypothetical protein
VSDEARANAVPTVGATDSAGDAAQPSAALRLVVVAIFVLAAIPIVLVSAWSVWMAPRILAGDYLSYAAGGERLLAGAPLYPAFQLEGPFVLGNAAFGNGFVYPPPAAVASIPFSLLGPYMGFVMFAGLTALALGVTVAHIGRREGLSRPVSIVFGLVFVLSGPGIEAIATGQANTLVAAMVAATWVWPKATGWIAVLGGLIKLFPAASLAWAIREKAPIVRPLLLGAALVAGSILLLGWDSWRDFITTLRNGHGTPLTIVPSPREFLAIGLGETIASVVAYGIAGLLCLGALVVRSRYAAFAMIAFAMIVPGPDWYLHYLLIPLDGIAPWLATVLVGLGRAWRGNPPATATSPAA